MITTFKKRQPTKAAKTVEEVEIPTKVNDTTQAVVEVCAGCVAEIDSILETVDAEPEKSDDDWLEGPKPEHPWEVADRAEDAARAAGKSERECDQIWDAAYEAAEKRSIQWHEHRGLTFDPCTC